MQVPAQMNEQPKQEGVKKTDKKSKKHKKKKEPVSSDDEILSNSEEEDAKKSSNKPVGNQQPPPKVNKPAPAPAPAAAAAPSSSDFLYTDALNAIKEFGFDEEDIKLSLEYEEGNAERAITHLPLVFIKIILGR